MFFRMGNYRHSTNEVELATSRITTKDQAGRPIFYTDKWQLRGQLQAEGVYLLAAQNALMAAYRDDRVRLCSVAGLFYDNGTATVYNWNSFNSLGGFRCVNGPDFPRGDGQQWVNARDYDISLECDFPHFLQSNTMEWRESLTFNGGGGPRLVGIECRYGLPEIQQTSRATPVTVVQEGRALGRYYYPKEPPPMYPKFFNSPGSSIRRVTPNLQVAGAYGTQTDYEITWRYEMILPRYITAAPRPWNGS